MKYIALPLLMLFSVVSIPSEPVPTVLLLNSYHPQYPWTEKLTQGVVDALLHHLPPENIHIEYMDSRRFTSVPIYAEKLKALFDFKYQYYEPDILITSDDYAYNFMLDHRDEVFQKKPIIFSGVNVFDWDRFNASENFTGILEGMEIEKNLMLIKRLQPKVNKVVLLGGTSGLSLNMVNEAKKIRATWPDKSVSIEIWDSFSMAELYERVSKLPATTAILMLAIHNDRLGHYFSYSNDLKKLTNKSTVPIYGMWGGVMMGSGVIGGYMNDPYEHGQEAGFLALAVLAGTPVNEIEVQSKSKFMPMFDFNVLDRYRIDMGALPDDSVIVNSPSSIYQTYKREINTLIVFFSILIFIINILLVNIRRRVHFENELEALNIDLERKVEERTAEINQRNQELNDAHSRMEELANTDMLTGLGNRRAAQKEADAYINRARVEGGELSVALLDIDHFKQINDSHGHQVGDEVLFSFAQVLRQAVRPSDRVYRWGGEEFLILLPSTPMALSVSVCNRILKDLNHHPFATVGLVTASIGVSSLNGVDSNEALINRADEHLYIAKGSGRNQVVTGD